MQPSKLELSNLDAQSLFDGLRPSVLPQHNSKREDLVLPPAMPLIFNSSLPGQVIAPSSSIASAATPPPAGRPPKVPSPGNHQQQQHNQHNQQDHHHHQKQQQQQQQQQQQLGVAHKGACRKGMLPQTPQSWQTERDKRGPQPKEDQLG
uniref:Uncharacterized protein n=1 Tax=Dunaliella tertiolecta TaxID=3047 RepID=A0A7S3QZ33_DUNTE